MESVRKDLSNVRVKNLHQFGDLKFEEEIHMKLLSDKEKKFKKKYQLLCFNRAIVAIELEEQEVFHGLNLAGMSKTSKKIVKKYSYHFRMQGFKQKIKPPEKDEKGKWIVKLKSWGDGPDVDLEKSFCVKYSNSDEKSANQFRDKIEELRCRAHRKIEPSEEHRGHKFHKYSYEVSRNTPSDHKKCGHCGDFLLGKLLRGIECESCRNVYHEECFKSGNSSAEMEDLDLSTVPDVDIVYVTQERQFLFQEMNRQESKDLLRDKNPGSFLVRYSDKEGKYVLSKRTSTGFSHETIKQKKVRGVTYFWIQPGQGKRTILDVIKIHQLDRELYFPISNRQMIMASNSNDEEDNDYEDYNVDSTSMRLSNLSRGSEEDVHENISWEDFYHGDMDRNAAKLKLKESTIYLYHHCPSDFTLYRTVSRGHS